jgi:hypothetical protein
MFEWSCTLVNFGSLSFLLISHFILLVPTVKHFYVLHYRYDLFCIERSECMATKSTENVILETDNYFIGT